MSDQDPNDEPPLRAVEDESPRARFRRTRGVYLLPNLITTGAMFSGFYAIVAGIDGHFVAAAVAIYVAFVLDALDGRVARMMGSESEFGAQYDSLSDMVAFGVAPALVAFSFALSELGQVGWVVTFIYMACAALRLARFNVQHSNSTFTGLASPSAATIVVSSVWVLSETSATPGLGTAIATAIAVGVPGVLMVSSNVYFSPKELNLKGRVPFVTLVGVVIGMAVIFIDPPRVLLLCAAIYALSGPSNYAWRRLRRRSAASNRAPPQEGQDQGHVDKETE